MAPLVACNGAAVIEKQFLAFPEVSILFEEDFWWRYIDDVFSVTEGEKQSVDRALSLFNTLYTGQVTLIWEWSEKILVRAECVGCPWLQAEIKVATIGLSGVRAPTLAVGKNEFGHYFR